MFYIKHSALNILRNRKLFLPLVAVLFFSLYLVMFAIGMNRNIIAAYEGSFLPTVAIVDRDSRIVRVCDVTYMLTPEFVEGFALTQYVRDYYILTEVRATPHTTTPVSNQGYWWDGVPVYYLRLGAYSDVSLSLDFVEERRHIIYGRFPTSANEVIIGEMLAAVNDYTIGSTITVDTYYSFFRPVDTPIAPPPPREGVKIDLEVVGIFACSEANRLIEFGFINSICTEFTFTRRYFPDTRHGPSAINAGMLTNRRNDLLTVQETITTHDLPWAITTILYYMHDAQAAGDFMQAINDVLPPTLIALDNFPLQEYLEILVDRINNAFFWLFLIVGGICIIFSVLVIHFHFKSRAYDIGVFRSRGMSRDKVAILFTCEVLVAAFLAFLFACLIFNISFATVAREVQISQSNYMLFNVMASSPSPVASNAVTQHDFMLSFSIVEFAGGLLAVIAFTAIIGLISTAYIARNEPMKTLAA